MQKLWRDRYVNRSIWITPRVDDCLRRASMIKHMTIAQYVISLVQRDTQLPSDILWELENAIKAEKDEKFGI